jgi:hypothetical protein
LIYLLFWPDQIRWKRTSPEAAIIQQNTLSEGANLIFIYIFYDFAKLITLAKFYENNTQPSVEMAIHLVVIDLL